MSKCTNCGKNSLFLKVNYEGLCHSCETIFQQAENNLTQEFLAVMDMFEKAINPKMYDAVLKALEEIQSNSTKLRLIEKVIKKVSTDEYSFFSNRAFGLLFKSIKKSLYDQCIESVLKEKSQYPSLPIKKQLALYESEVFKVVGVTFNNGRRKRQTILKQIYFRDPPYSKDPDITLKKYDFEGHPAIAVYANHEQVGNISKNDLDKILYRWDRYYDVSEFAIYGGGKDSDGNQLSYGMEIRVRFKRQ